MHVNGDDNFTNQNSQSPKRHVNVDQALKNTVDEMDVQIENLKNNY